MVNRNTVFSNVIWRFAERVGAQGVKLIVELLLARLLLPDDYGVIAIVTVIINLLNVFVDSGLGNALIQKKDADELDFSSVFWFNVLCCLILYAITYCFAPYIAKFFNRSELTLIIRVLTIQIIISGVKNVQQAYVARNLQFKKFFFATLGGTIGAAFFGILLAYKGLGVWALVTQQLLNAALDTMILWRIVKWRPRREFSLSRLAGLLSFGWKLLVSSLVETLYIEIRQIVIGKKYSSSDLAYYNKGQQFPMFIVGNVCTSIDSVIMPAMSTVQDDKERLKSMTRRAIKTNIYVIAPIMMGLFAIATPLIRLLLTEKWIDCVPYMRILCITYMFYPIHTANLNAIKAMGRSDLYLKLEIIKKVVGLAALLLTMNISVMAMAYSLLFTEVAGQIINTWPNKKLLDYGYFEQMEDIFPTILLAVVMGACVFATNNLNVKEIILLPLQISLGIIIYVSGSSLLRIDSLYYMRDIIIGILKKKEGDPSR